MRSREEILKYANNCIERLELFADKVGLPDSRLADLALMKELVALIEQPQWIPCSDRLPEEPKENPIFEGKPLELYLVSVKNADYPFRAFWNGRIFTDGFGKVDAIAWQPLPEPYKGEQE